LGKGLGVESHGVVCIVPPTKAPDAMTDRGDVASSTLHSSLAEGPKTVLAGVGTVRLETGGCPDVKGPIPRSVLMSETTLQPRSTPVKRKNLPHRFPLRDRKGQKRHTFGLDAKKMRQPG
jgi:hypothetical protein